MDLAKQVDPKEIIAFLDVSTFGDDNQAFRGGCLITDRRTHPLEFRMTSPIEPTPLQTILYGKTLKSYVSIDLIVVPLLEVIKTQPVIILIRSSIFLMARPQARMPMVLVSTSEDGKVQFQSHKSFAEDQQLLPSYLHKVKKEFILEPFMRIQSALKEAHHNQVGNLG